MKKGGVFSLGICFIVLICFGPAWAEEVARSESKKDYQVFDLGEIFVTSEKPPAVQEVVITNEVSAEDIKATNSHTVAEALAFVPGIRVSTGRKNQPMIQIHGMDQTKVLVLIDGVPYYETKYGWLDLNEIPVDNVAKIEVTKGAASVLYGPNALMGVVNIITKKPTEKPSAEATLEVGPYDTNKVSVSHGMKVGIFSYWLNYGHQESDGWRLSHDFDPVIGTITTGSGKTATKTTAILEDGGYRNNSDYKTDSFWAKVGIDPNPGSEYYLNFHYITREKGDPPSLYGGQVLPSRPAFSSVFDRIPKYDDWGVDLSGQQKIFDPLTLKGKLFYHNHVDDYASYSDQNYENPIAVSRYKDYNLGGSLLADVRPLKWDIIRLAFNYRGDSHKQRDDEYLPFAETFSYTGSVGLENEFNLIRNLSVVAGASYDWFTVTKAKKDITNSSGNFLRQDDAGKPDTMNNFDPMIGATYSFADTTKLFGSVARKVRFPTLDQLYSSKGGNLDLKAEKAINYTLGVSRLFSKFAKAELAGFYHDISDFISRDADPHINPLAQYQNYAKTSMLGFELNGELYPMKDLVLRAGYTFNYARNKSEGRVSDDLVNVPEHKIDMGVSYTIPCINTRLDLVGIYMGKIFSQLPTPTNPTQATTKVDNYYIANVRISKSFLKYFEAYLALNNIFDKNYESEYGFPGPGRNFYLGVSAKY
jgi:outer membrane receptor protein involved in Fe transport